FAMNSASRATPTDEQVWQVLGLRLTPAPETQVQALQPRYRGGMRVTEVRPNSLASRHGIQPGDILVGLHDWETVNFEDVSWILSHPKFSTFDSLKFYANRCQETLWGDLQLTTRTQ